MDLDIYVNYRGTCEEAFRFYEQHLGGRITGMVRHGEQPNPAIPAEWKEKILHARIEIGTTVLMGADILQAEPMRSAYLTLTLDSEADAERVYALLTDGGEDVHEDGQDPLRESLRHASRQVRRVLDVAASSLVANGAPPPFAAPSRLAYARLRAVTALVMVGGF